MPNFRADCSNCCGLCCVVFNLLSVQGFPVDKPAETPCIHLDGRHRCSIHAKRRTHGYGACEAFDCFGVGQWITQKLFGGAHWTDSPDLARQMFSAYSHWAPRFEAAALIEAALCYARKDAQESLVVKMQALTSIETEPPLYPTDRSRLRRETLAAIRAALPIGDSGANEPRMTSASDAPID
jgi:hypothetical protein